MIPHRFFDLVFVGSMSLAMGAAMSLMMILMEVGVTESFWNEWFQVFVKSTLVAFPTSLIIAPLARKLTSFLVAN